VEVRQKNAGANVPRVVAAGGGERLNVLGEDIRVKLSGAETRGEFALFLETTPPNAGPPPHIHGNEDETFVVIEGEYEFLVGSETKRVKAGDVVYGPKGVPHTFKNVGAVVGRMYVTATPAGFENFFRRVDKEINASAPDIPKLLAIGAEHGLTFLA
jgi:mannose-6-phosphate isomerase-like protein (cupin superfamily)